MRMTILFLLAAIACNSNPYKNGEADEAESSEEGATEESETTQTDPHTETETTTTTEPEGEGELDDLETVDEFEGDEPGECLDGADNDRDGLFDCDDPDCAGAPDCNTEPDEDPEEQTEPVEDPEDPEDDPSDPQEDPEEDPEEPEGTDPTEDPEEPDEVDDPEEPEVDPCQEWQATWNFDDETDNAEYSEIVLESDIHDVDPITATFTGEYNVFTDDDCFSLPGGSDVKMCVRGFGVTCEEDDTDCPYDGATVIIALEAGYEANWLELVGCDYDDNPLDVVAFDGSDLQVGDAYTVTESGENSCHAVAESVVWDHEQLWTYVVLSVENDPGKPEALALSELTIGKDCPPE